MRIFIGTDDTAQVLTGLALGLRELGHDVTTMVRTIGPFTKDAKYDIVRGFEILAHADYRNAPWPLPSLGYRLDYHLVSPLANALSTRQYLNHDLFIILYRSWVSERVVYPLLKRLKKKLVVYYCGSDVRHISAFAQEFDADTSKWTREFTHDPLLPKLQRLRTAELHADAIFSVPDQAGLQIRPYYHSQVPLDVLRTATPNVPRRRRPVILHAPSRPELKGTDWVVAAVEELKREGIELDFQMLSGVPRARVLDVLRDADILVDELVFHGPGVLSAEAMATGCAVATRTLDGHKNVFDPPVCSVRRENLVPRLRRLVTDLDYRSDLAHRGREWVLKAFDPKFVAQKVLDATLGRKPPDYQPDFYLRSYRLPTDVRLTAKLETMGAQVAARFRNVDEEVLRSAAQRGLIARPVPRPTAA